MEPGPAEGGAPRNIVRERQPRLQGRDQRRRTVVEDARRHGSLDLRTMQRQVVVLLHSSDDRPGGSDVRSTTVLDVRPAGRWLAMGRAQLLEVQHGSASEWDSGCQYVYELVGNE